jgi:flagellar motor switch protein FliN/FliY
MSTAPPLPETAAPQAPETGQDVGTELVVENPLLLTPLEGGMRSRLSPAMARLPVELDVAVAVREFRVRNLLALAPGQVIETTWGHGQDVPLAAGDVQLAWSEFEVVETQLAVRVTRLV